MEHTVQDAAQPRSQDQALAQQRQVIRVGVRMEAQGADVKGSITLACQLPDRPTKVPKSEGEWTCTAGILPAYNRGADRIHSL